MNLCDSLGKLVLSITQQNAADIIDFEEEINRVVARRPIRRRTDNFWPASINSTYDCERKQALTRIEKIYTDKMLEHPLRYRVMDLGTSIHRIIQDSYLAPTEILYGNWRCPNCRQTTHKFTTYPPGYCKNNIKIESETGAEEISCEAYQRNAEASGYNKWLYDELRVKHDELNISGRVDGVIIDKKSDNFDWYTLEIKSVSPDVFNEVTQVKLTTRKFPGILNTELDGAVAILPSHFTLPKSNHVTQGSIYSQLLLKAAWEDKIPLNPSNFCGVFFLYVNRNDLQTRSFIRESTEQDYNNATQSVLRILEAVQAADKTPRESLKEERERVDANRQLVLGSLRKTCSTRTDPRAIICPWQTICFPYKDVSKNKVEYLV